MEVTNHQSDLLLGVITEFFPERCLVNISLVGTNKKTCRCTQEVEENGLENHEASKIVRGFESLHLRHSIRTNHSLIHVDAKAYI